MQIGKLPPAILNKKVLSFLRPLRSDILVRSTIGQDSSIVDMQQQALVISSDPITGVSESIGWYAVHIACNDVAANGAEPVGVTLTVLLPPDAREELVENIMRDAARAACEINVEILGGHTEVTDAVTRPVVSTTAIGKCDPHHLVVPENIKPDMDIVLTKGAGIEGTSILACEKEAELRAHLTSAELEQARHFNKFLSVVPESRIAVEQGAVAMHDVTEGGVLGALWEMAQTADCGFRVWENRIICHDVTQKICRAMNINPLRLISSGAMLIYCCQGAKLVNALKEAGIQAAVIGQTTETDFSLITKEGVRQPVEPPESDELWRVLG